MTRWRPCERHAGRHLDIYGQCVHPGAPVALKPAVCGECGEEIMRRLDLATGRVTVVEAGSDHPHRHAAPLRVEIDQDELAGAIVQASRAARQERQAEPAAVYPQSTLAYQPPRVPPPARSEEREIPTVTVWVDDGAGR